MNHLMDLETTTKFLALVATYWPSSNMVEGMAGSWSQAINTYPKADAWEALKQFRSEEDRKFAPTISELIGRMDYLNKFHEKERVNAALLIEAPRRKNDFEALETYSYKTGRTTPKRGKDEPEFEVRTAIRCSHERLIEIEETMERRGFFKSFYPLAGNKRGYIWKNKNI